MNCNGLLLLFLSLLPCALFANETDAPVDVHPVTIGVDAGAVQNAGSGAEILLLEKSKKGVQ